MVKLKTRMYLTLVVMLSFGLVACDDNNKLKKKPAPGQDVTISGSVQDGPVTGGSIYVFTASTVLAALDAAELSDDRAAALAGSSPLVALTRSESDESSYSLSISGEYAGQALFFLFDSEGAIDETFADQPFNLEAAIVVGNAGSSMTINLTPHTTLASVQVRNALDPDGDGQVISTATIQSEIDSAMANVLDALGQDDFGVDLFDEDDDPTSLIDHETLEDASTYIGSLVRRVAAIADSEMDEVILILAADSADGVIDGAAPTAFTLDADQSELVVDVATIKQLSDSPIADNTNVSCSANAASLKQACGYEVLDEFFVGAAQCADTSSETEVVDCMAELALEYEEVSEECGDIYEARLEVCDELNDEIYEPAFGSDYAANFIDPLEIGVSVTANPYFPLVQGNEWLYRGEFEEDGENIVETVRIIVTNKTKLIDGIHCLVVQDIVHKNGELVEDTNDWFAQDVDGNIWYCGEEVKDYEYFEGDEPPTPELVAIDGSFKAGLEGDKAGISLPAPDEAEVGDIIRQEVSWANAEDTIEILAFDNNDQSVAGFGCNNNCLKTRDFSPMDPGVEEEKYYLPGVGRILEYDTEEPDARIELIEFTQI